MTDTVRLYGLTGQDRLDTDVDTVIERAIDDACDKAGEPFDMIASRITWPIRVWEYRHIDLPKPEILAKQMLEDVLDRLDEEYGDPDGDPSEPTPDMLEAAIAFARVVLAGYTPWTCKQTGTFVDVTVEQARAMVGAKSHD